VDVNALARQAVSGRSCSAAIRNGSPLFVLFGLIETVGYEPGRRPWSRWNAIKGIQVHIVARAGLDIDNLGGNRSAEDETI